MNRLNKQIYCIKIIIIIMKEKTIDLSQKRYHGEIDTIFIFRNDFFLCPPFFENKILNDYDKNHIVIKDIKYFYGDETHDGSGYELYHNISFLSNGIYEIHIENLRTNIIEKYTFIITSSRCNNF